MYTIAEQQPIQCVIPSLLEYLLQYYTYSKEPGIEASIMQTNLILRMNRTLEELQKICVAILSYSVTYLHLYSLILNHQVHKHTWNLQ